MSISKFFDYPRLLWPLRSVASAIIVFTSVPICGMWMIIRIKMGAGHVWTSRIVRNWCHFVLCCAGVTVEVEGLEYDDPSRPCLIVSNHQSLFDIPASWFAIQGDIRMVAKLELFKIPIFGQAITAIGFISVDRGNRSSGQAAAELMQKRLSDGMQVWIAPEGTRSPDGKIQNFKKGSFGIALDNKIRIAPIVIKDSWRVCPKGSLLPRPGSVIHVKLLPPIEPEDFVKFPDRAAMAAHVQKLMTDALDS